MHFIERDGGGGGGAQQHAKLIGKNVRNFFFLNTKGCGAGNLKCHTSFCHLALFTDMENIVVKIILSVEGKLITQMFCR